MVEGLLFFPHAHGLFIVKEANVMNLYTTANVTSFLSQCGPLHLQHKESAREKCNAR
jgi:hypothetical protein